MHSIPCQINRLRELGEGHTNGAAFGVQLDPLDIVVVSDDCRDGIQAILSDLARAIRLDELQGHALVHR